MFCSTGAPDLANAVAMFDNAVIDTTNMARANDNVTYECDSGFFISYGGGGNGTMTAVE